MIVNEDGQIVDEVKEPQKTSNEDISAILEEAEEIIRNENPIEEYTPIKNKKRIFPFVLMLILILIGGIIIAFLSFSIMNNHSDKIFSGISIRGVDISGLTKEQAIDKINQYLESQMPQTINLKKDDYEATISLDQIRAKMDVETAVNTAYGIGRGKNIIANNFEIIRTKFGKQDLDMRLMIDMKQLKYIIGDIAAKMPNTVVQSSYYVEGNNLIITAGKEGPVVEQKQLEDTILQEIMNLSYKDKVIEIPVRIQKPNAIDVDKIHSEIYKEAKDAYYTTNPFEVHPHVNGVDFNVEQVKQMLQKPKEEYMVKLTITKPKVTTNMIGSEAFPDLISSYSTKYSTRNKDRTTNLRLAAEKIDGTVLMPGEEFSYNKVVGERTIAAGYKEAPIYQDGQVVDGLGGGICQISTTLYNAVLYANLEILERRNHQFVPSYVPAGRDATVVYGAIDFRFKNSRSYPIKIKCSVSGGIAKFEIYGLKEQNEYEVTVSSKVTSKTKNAIKSETYQTVKQNGNIIRSGVISRDTYKVH